MKMSFRNYFYRWESFITVLQNLRFACNHYIKVIECLSVRKLLVEKFGQNSYDPSIKSIQSFTCL